MSSLIKKKVILFYNPTSGDGLFQRNLDYIIGRFQDADYQIVPIRAGKGKDITLYFEAMNKETYKDEYRQIIAAGGDGTINVCVNAMINNDIDLPLAVFPAGTANDFAHYFEMPDNIEEMVEIALGENYTYSDVGVVNNSYFINVAAIGSMVDVSQKTDPMLKNTLGIVAYYLKGLSEVTSLKPIKVKLSTPKISYEEEMFFMVVMNGKSAGGFKNISPDGDINDGLLDVILFRSMPIYEMAPLLIKVLQGNHVEHKNILMFKGSEIRIESDVDISTDIDGEKGERFPLNFSVLHNKLKIFTKESDVRKVL